MACGWWLDVPSTMERSEGSAPAHCRATRRDPGRHRRDRRRFGARSRGRGAPHPAPASGRQAARPRLGRAAGGRAATNGPGAGGGALEQLAAADHGDPHRAVHEARKSIKRLRAIVRMLEGQLGGRGCALEDDALRAAAGLLASARDTEVMVSSLDLVVRSTPSGCPASRAWCGSGEQLAAERERRERQVLEPSSLLRVSDELRLFRARAAAWQLPDAPAIGPVEYGLAADLPVRAAAGSAARRASAAGACARCISGESGSRTSATRPKPCSAADPAAQARAQLPCPSAGPRARRGGCGGWPDAPTGSAKCSARSTTSPCWASGSPPTAPPPAPAAGRGAAC